MINSVEEKPGGALKKLIVLRGKRNSLNQLIDCNSIYSALRESQDDRIQICYK